MCFFASIVIDSLAANGFLLVVEAFAVFFNTSYLYFSYKEKQIINLTTLIIIKM
jgi:hypothetical protein